MEELDFEDLEVTVKIVVVGNGNVGKTSLTSRFCKGFFSTEHKKTIGVDFMEKRLEIGAELINMMIWDTAGQEEFDALTRRYYKGADGALVAFSTVDRDSFLAIGKWVGRIREECGDIPIILVQNKVDLLHKAMVDSGEVERAAEEHDCKLFRTCVPENMNVADSFTELAQMILNYRAEAARKTALEQAKKKKEDSKIESKRASSPAKGGEDQAFFKRTIHETEKKEQVLDLKPSRVRTGGKKKRMPLWCSLV